jgi:hypothetical protein
VPRARIRIRRFPLEVLGRLVLAIFAVVLIWYGGMLVLLALGVKPGTVETLSGYRSAFDWATGLSEADATEGVRLATGLGGLAAFLVFGYLALRAVPRPYLARSSVLLGDTAKGTTDVSPRAVERVAEVAAAQNRAISSARGRLEDETVVLEVSTSHARHLEETLHDVQRRALDGLRRHELAVRAVDVTLTGFERTTRRELR